MRKYTDTDDRGILFNVDILVKSPSNALALQYLLEMFNSKEKVVDFRIKSGSNLGELIDVMVQAKESSSETAASDFVNSEPGDLVPEEVDVTKTSASTKNTDTMSSIPGSDAAAGSSPFEWIKQFSRDNRLVRLTTNQRGKQVSLPCRILNFDEANALVNVYHVDEKQVYTFKINEIDEFSVTS